MLYEVENVLLLGRLMSGPGGDVVTSSAIDAIRAEDPGAAEGLVFHSFSERDKRHGQAVAAASLPALTSILWDCILAGDDMNAGRRYAMASRVGERGQITIEKAIREDLGVYAGDQAIQRIEDGRVVIEFVPAAHRRSLAGVLRRKVTQKPADERWSVLREAALETADPDRRAG